MKMLSFFKNDFFFKKAVKLNHDAIVVSHCEQLYGEGCFHKNTAGSLDTINLSKN